MTGLPDMLANTGNLLLLISIGLGVGTLSGFAGVGGSFIITPALIIIGFPANLAVGTGLAWVAGKSVIGSLQHGRLKNIDYKLGLVILIASTAGMEGGVRLLNWAKEKGLATDVVLSVSACMLLFVGIYTLIECSRRKKELDRLLKAGAAPPSPMKSALSQRIQSIRLPPVISFPRSGVRISVWVLVLIGLFVGALAGVMGVGGGFIMVPSMVYIVGMPSFMAVGTDLFQIMFSSTYGSIRHTLSGNVYIFASFLMILTSSFGVHFGSLVTKYVRGLSVRYILGISMLLCAAGVLVKLYGVVLDPDDKLFEYVSVAITFGGVWLTVALISGLFIIALRYRKRRSVPGWTVSFVASDNGAGSAAH